jgi:hypothetical protein
MTMLAETGLVLGGTILGDITVAGAVLLTEGTPSDIVVAWRAHHDRLLITAVVADHEVHGPIFPIVRCLF